MDEARARLQEVERLAAGGAGSVGALVERLDEPSWPIRRAVVAALAAAGDAALGSLFQVLRVRRDDEGRLAAAVDAVVGSTGAADAGALELSLDHQPAVVCDALQILGRRRTRSAVARIAELVGHADDNVGVAAVEALGRIGGEGAVQPLVAAVESGGFFRRFPAIDVLGRTGDPRAVSPLASLLEDPLFALEAARALGRTGDGGAVRALARLLAKGSVAQLRAAAAAIVEIDADQRRRFGDSPVPAELARAEGGTGTRRRLLHALPNADGAERAAICRVLGWLGGDDAVAGLLDALGDELEVARAAADALLAIGPAGEAALTRAVTTAGPDRSARRALILPLLAGRRSAREAALASVDDVSAAVRAVACEVLGRTGDASIVASLFALIGDPDGRVAHAASVAIQTLGGEETERLATGAARDPDARTRRAGVRILAYFGRSTALGALLAASQDADARVRDAAIGGLALVDHPDAVTALLDASRAALAPSRAAAARAFGHARPRQSTVMRLGELLGDDDAWVRYYACQALSRLRDATHADAIVALVRDPAGQVRVAAIEALARLQGDAALETLSEAARSDDADLCRAALIGLGIVKRVEAWPVLEEAVHAPQAATRLVALSALAELDDARVGQVLAEAALDDDDSVRQAAVTLLEARPDATARLVALLRHPPMHERAVDALARAVDGRARAVGAALRDADPDVAGGLASALVRTRTAEAESELVDVLATGGVHARRAAAVALAGVRTSAARAALGRAAHADADEDVRKIGLAAARP